jgi:hypothetical protein
VLFYAGIEPCLASGTGGGARRLPFFFARREGPAVTRGVFEAPVAAQDAARISRFCLAPIPKGGRPASQDGGVRIGTVGASVSAAAAGFVGCVVGELGSKLVLRSQKYGSRSVL